MSQSGVSNRPCPAASVPHKSDEIVLVEAADAEAEQLLHTSPATGFGLASAPAGEEDHDGSAPRPQEEEDIQHIDWTKHKHEVCAINSSAALLAAATSVAALPAAITEDDQRRVPTGDSMANDNEAEEEGIVNVNEQEDVSHINIRPKAMLCWPKELAHSAGIVEASADGRSKAKLPCLARDGPQESIGSEGHPWKCRPCSLFCFGKRGCRKGADCMHCHQQHKSWNKREFRSSRAAAATTMTTTASSSLGQVDMVPPSPSTSFSSSHSSPAAEVVPPREEVVPPREEEIPCPHFGGFTIIRLSL